jgi:hypothetical protein
LDSVEVEQLAAPVLVLKPTVQPGTGGPPTPSVKVTVPESCTMLAFGRVWPSGVTVTLKVTDWLTVVELEGKEESVTVLCDERTVSDALPLLEA